jgi:hypothetical protein
MMHRLQTNRLGGRALGSRLACRPLAATFSPAHGGHPTTAHSGIAWRLRLISGPARAVPEPAASSSSSSSTTAPGYWTLENAYRFEAEVKKSRFVVTAWPISTAPQVRAEEQARVAVAAGCRCSTRPPRPRARRRCS